MKAEKENRERKTRYEEKQAESNEGSEHNPDESVDDDRGISVRSEGDSEDDSSDNAPLDGEEDLINTNVEEEE